MCFTGLMYVHTYDCVGVIGCMDSAYSTCIFQGLFSGCTAYVGAHIWYHFMNPFNLVSLRVNGVFPGVHLGGEHRGHLPPLLYSCPPLEN